jgi:hypothetical protein
LDLMVKGLQPVFPAELGFEIAPALNHDRVGEAPFQSRVINRVFAG